MWLHRLAILAEEGLLDRRDEAVVGDVDPVELDLGVTTVEEVVELLLRVVLDRLVGVEVAGIDEHLHVPAAGVVAGDLERAVVQGEGVVVELGEVEIGDGADALAAGAHAAQRVVGLGFLLFDAALGGLDHAGAGDGGDVERERVRGADVGITDLREQAPEQGIRIRGRADGGALVRAHAFLIDDDRRREAFEVIDVGAGEVRHETLHESGIGLVDHALRFGGDRVEDEG